MRLLSSIFPLGTRYVYFFCCFSPLFFFTRWTCEVSPVDVMKKNNNFPSSVAVSFARNAKSATAKPLKRLQPLELVIMKACFCHWCVHFSARPPPRPEDKAQHRAVISRETSDYFDPFQIVFKLNCDTFFRCNQGRFTFSVVRTGCSEAK